MNGTRCVSTIMAHVLHAAAALVFGGASTPGACQISVCTEKTLKLIGNKILSSFLFLVWISSTCWTACVLRRLVPLSTRNTPYTGTHALTLSCENCTYDGSKLPYFL